MLLQLTLFILYVQQIQIVLSYVISSQNHRCSNTLLYDSNLLLSEIELEKRLIDEFNEFKQQEVWSSIISNSQFDQLEEFTFRFVDWNSKVNLVSRKDIENFIPNHLIPCLSIGKVRKFHAKESIVDVGTGGGLPGIPMAIINPEASFMLLDSNSKKMMVVEDMVNGLKLDHVIVKTARAETVDERFDFLLGRAVSAIPNFLSFSSSLLKPLQELSLSDLNNHDSSSYQGVNIDSGLLYMKGGEFENELEEAGIKNSHKFAINDLANIDYSDKYILHVTADEIHSFRERQLDLDRKLKTQKKNTKNRKRTT